MEIGDCFDQRCIHLIETLQFLTFFLSLSCFNYPDGEFDISPSDVESGLQPWWNNLDDVSEESYAEVSGLIVQEEDSSSKIDAETNSNQEVPSPSPI